MEWITTHWSDVLAAVGGLVVVAGIIARLTPTKKDDKVVGIIKKLLDYFSPGGINKGLSKD